jgi:hypothetical protein
MYVYMYINIYILCMHPHIHSKRSACCSSVCTYTCTHMWVCTNSVPAICTLLSNKQFQHPCYVENPHSKRTSMYKQKVHKLCTYVRIVVEEEILSSSLYEKIQYTHTRYMFHACELVAQFTFHLLPKICIYIHTHTHFAHTYTIHVSHL